MAQKRAEIMLFFGCPGLVLLNILVFRLVLTRMAQKRAEIMLFFGRNWPKSGRLARNTKIGREE